MKKMNRKMKTNTNYTTNKINYIIKILTPIIIFKKISKHFHKYLYNLFGIRQVYY